MAITFDTATTKTNGVVSSFSFNHTTASGNKRFLIVAIAMQDVTSVSSITYNGVSLTAGPRATQASTSSEIWYLANPDTGTNSVSVTLSGATAFPTATAITFQGVAQTSTIDGSNTATGNSTTPSVSVTTSVANSWVVDAVAVQTDTGDITLTVDASQTQRSNVTSSSQERQGTSTETTTSAGAVSMDWTLSASRKWSIVAVGIKQGGIDNTLTLANGSYTTTGYSLAFVYGRKLVMAVGMYTLTGISALLTLFQKWINQSKNTSTLTNQTKNSSSWSNSTKNSSSWTNQNKN